MINSIDSWENLESDIEDLFNNPNSITGKRFAHVYLPLKNVISEIQNKLEHYQNNPKDFSSFVLENPNHVDNLFDWLPYLSGDRAKLLDIKFFDKNDNEILDKSFISKIIKENDSAQNETYIYIFLNNSRVAELNNGSKILKENNSKSEHTVYADVNLPA